MRAVPRAAAAITLLASACFNPDRPAASEDDTGSTSDPTTETSTDTPTTSNTNPTTTATTEPSTDPTTETSMTTDPTEESVDSSSTGDCDTEGCPCIADNMCGKGLVCRDDACAPLVCGDGLIESTEVCDDSNKTTGDGCDDDCTLTEILDIQVAYTRTCALIEGGRVRCWGLGNQGQLGYGNTDNVGDDETPADAGDVMLPGPAEQLTTGDGHNCVLTDEGDVICWGTGGSGQLGYANTNNIGDDEFPSTLDAVNVGAVNLQVAAGGSQSCSLGMAGTARCWGSGFGGQLGYGNNNTIGDDEPPSVAGNVPVGAALTELCAGIGHTCAVLSNGDVKCWGQNFAGQLGYGNTNAIGDDETPSTQPALSFEVDAEHITCGLQHSCALFEDGSVRCWGANGNGELGQGNTTPIGDDEPATMALAISLGGSPVAISAGDNHTCARFDDGAVRCWGANGNGQLGIGSTVAIGDDELPDSVDPIDTGGTVTRIDAGGNNTCVIYDDQRVRCWGWNEYGQNGYGDLLQLGDDELPADIPDLPLLVAP
jgi:cysteine-rich repeat protein